VDVAAKRAVPLHWTSLLSVVSLTCLTVLTITGVVLLAFYDRSTDTVIYDGSYALLQGVPVSRAYASTLHISLDVPGGLLVRQTHHWAALVLPASLLLQLLSTFFTAGFRRPRHWSWVLLFVTFFLALGAGWSGYGLPDDQLAGTGLKIAEGIVIGIPFIGTRLSFLFFGGEFPGNAIEHMYWLHVLVIPVLLAAVLALRLWLAAQRPPPQLPGLGRTQLTVVGLPLRAIAVRATGLAFVTTGVLVLLGGLMTVNPIWIHGPADPASSSSGSQPDWYTGFLDGSLRLVPSGWEVEFLGHTIPLAVLVPQAVVGIFLGVVLLWPFLESRATRDRDPHHMLQRPREHPVRTAFGVAGLVFFIALWAAGATDIVTHVFGVAFEHQVVALRAVVLLGPLIAFPVTVQLCRALAAAERDQVLDGVESGRILRGAEGGFTESHIPLRPERAAIVARGRQ
jgi:ubiquinol-cytochrome c reductase cytochrome b subunit